MEEIEEELYKIHAEARKTRGEDENVVNDEGVPPPVSERLAFGTITKLDEGSPANTAVSIQTRKKVTRPLIFTSASRCKGSELLDDFYCKLTSFPPCQYFCDAGQVPILRSAV